MVLELRIHRLTLLASSGKSAFVSTPSPSNGSAQRINSRRHFKNTAAIGSKEALNVLLSFGIASAESKVGPAPPRRPCQNTKNLRSQWLQTFLTLSLDKARVNFSTGCAASILNVTHRFL